MKKQKKNLNKEPEIKVYLGDLEQNQLIERLVKTILESAGNNEYKAYVLAQGIATALLATLLEGKQ